MITLTIPGARLPLDLDRRKLLLHLAHVVLHLLRLFHQVRELSLFIMTASAFPTG